MGLDVYVYTFEKMLNEPVEGWFEHLIESAPTASEYNAYYHADEDDLLQQLEGFMEQRINDGRPLSSIEVEVIRKWIKKADGKLLVFAW